MTRIVFPSKLTNISAEPEPETETAVMVVFRPQIQREQTYCSTGFLPTVVLSQNVSPIREPGTDQDASLGTPTK